MDAGVIYLLLILVLLAEGYYFAEWQLPHYLARSLPKADKVLVKKTERRLYLLSEGRVIEDYRIALGGNPLGHKIQEEDSRTPEGHYCLDWCNPRSRYFFPSLFRIQIMRINKVLGNEG